MVRDARKLMRSYEGRQGKIHDEAFTTFAMVHLTMGVDINVYAGKPYLPKYAGELGGYSCSAVSV